MIWVVPASRHKNVVQGRLEEHSDGTHNGGDQDRQNTTADHPTNKSSKSVNKGWMNIDSTLDIILVLRAQQTIIIEILIRMPKPKDNHDYTLIVWT